MKQQRRRWMITGAVKEAQSWLGRRFVRLLPPVADEDCGALEQMQLHYPIHLPDLIHEPAMISM